MRRFGRSRWFGLGVAVALVCGGAIRSDVGASVGSGERTVYVPITPCRLFDTRPGTDNVGLRSTPLGPGETFTIQARGSQGTCNLPADAVGLALNVAVIGGTAGSFLTVFPAGTDVPLAANLNWVAGQAPTPNKVDVGLSADGRVSFYNFAGSVHLAADVNGYYVDHHHDDRYYRKDETYSKAEVDAAVAGRAPKQPGKTSVAAPGFVLATGWTYTDGNAISGSNASQTISCAHAEIALPDGATITKFSAFVSTNAIPATPLTVRLSRKPLTSFFPTELATLPSSAGNGPGVTRSTTTISGGAVDTGTFAYYVEACGTGAVVSVSVEHSVP